MLTKRLKSYFPLIVLGIIIIFSGCSVGSNGYSGTQNTGVGSANIQMSNVTTIPAANFTLGE